MSIHHSSHPKLTKNETEMIQAYRVAVAPEQKLRPPPPPKEDHLGASPPRI
jgi:hypothetical protein